MKRHRISSSGRLPGRPKLHALEWLIVHEAAACVGRMTRALPPQDYDRRLLLTVSVRQCQRAVADAIRHMPEWRYYP